MPGAGRWAGGAAAGLGLEGPLDPDRFRLVLESRHPWTGGPWVRAGRRWPGSTSPSARRNRRACCSPSAAPRSRCAPLRRIATRCPARWRTSNGTRLAAARSEGAERHRHPDQRNGGRGLHACREPEPRPAPAQPRRDGEPRARRGRALGCVRPTRPRARTEPRPVRSMRRISASGLRSALGVGWTRPMAGSAEVVGVESGASWRVLLALRRHPSPCGRNGKPDGTGATSGVGRDTSGQVCSAPLSRSWPPSGPGGLGRWVRRRLTVTRSGAVGT